MASLGAFAAPASASASAPASALSTTSHVTGGTVTPNGFGCYYIFNGQYACVLWDGATTAKGGFVSVGAKTDLVMQDDGNLVDYDENGRARWASGTVGRGDHAVMQSDGNFVVYTAAGSPVWASNTARNNANAYLAVQQDGNIVIYNTANRAVWATGTNH